jgi:hypothetical protein
MRFLIIALAGLAVSACAVPVGSQAVLETGRYDRLEVGQSDKVDVYYLFGQPHDVSYEADASEWTYYSARGSIDGWTLVPVAGLIRNGTNFDVTTARFLFDEQDRLAAHDEDQFHHFHNSYSGLGDGWTPEATSEPVRLEMQKIGVEYDRRRAHDMANFVDMMRRRDRADASR